MDFSESTRIVFNRVKKLEPENVTKIIGYLLLQDHGDQEMIHLAISSDSVIQDFIYKIKAELHQLALKSSSSPIPVPPPTGVNESPFQFSPFSSRLALSPPLSFKSYWEHRTTAKRNAINELQNQTQFLSLEDQMEQVSLGNTGDYYYSSLEAARARRYQALSELPVKICHYFNKGFCKHGSNCRYYHGQVPESFPQMFGLNSMDVFNDDHIFSPGSLENLEFEIVELLQSRRGNPISIASLPMLYYEKFGKVLQADGYLTESQRHGKAGYSLTKLLARLRNSIRLIDRPHGQHAVILAEDASKYMDNRNERSDPGPIVSGSRQIYLTFPAESTFSEDDVSNYFSSYGPVEDVRIPCQQKRMFGFVTFASSDTVKMILAKGNPHFVCGARVLVKPYREKSKLVDRKYQERMDPSLYFCPQYSDMDSELHSFSRGCETSRLLRKQFMEEQEHAFEMERRRLAELRLMQKPLSNQPCFGYSMNDLKVSEDHLKFPSAEHFNYLLDVLNNGGSTNDDKARHVETKYTDQESGDGLNLPDSPFASPIATGISTVI